MKKIDEYKKIKLSEIIRGKKTRELFESYLKLSSKFYFNREISFHPCDIQRLDFFICAVFRYSRTTVDLDLLRNWLINEKNWSEKDALWCINRIATGLEILKSNKKFKKTFL